MIYVHPHADLRCFRRPLEIALAKNAADKQSPRFRAQSGVDDLKRRKIVGLGLDRIEYSNPGFALCFLQGPDSYTRLRYSRDLACY